MKPAYFMIILFSLIITITAEPPEGYENNENYIDDEALINDYEKEAIDDFNQNHNNLIDQPDDALYDYNQNQNNSIDQSDQLRQPFQQFQSNHGFQNNQNNNEYRDEEEDRGEEFCEHQSINNNTRYQIQEGFNNSNIQN